MEILASALGGALSVTAGVIVGAVLSRRAQDRHWLREQQLAAYQELLRQFATFSMILKRAHGDRSHWDYDWATWNAALLSASLVAPADVASAIDQFGRAVSEFLARADRNTTVDALSVEEFETVMRGPAEAQRALVNAIRLSFAKHQRPLPMWIGGALLDPPHWTEDDAAKPQAN